MAVDAAEIELDHELEHDVTTNLDSSQNVISSEHVQPNYWNGNSSILVSHANIHDVAFGTGQQIYDSVILPRIREAEHEVILVTCFWARSSTLNAVSETLQRLSEKALQDHRSIRVRICFSSCSIWQRLAQTSSLRGRLWPRAQWCDQLGLPPQDQLQGLDIEIKSIFQLPFSVMHPKFVVIDRSTVLLPSCNVSWEDWFEGCMTLTGPVVQQFVQFYNRFWTGDADVAKAPSGSGTSVINKPREAGTQAVGLLAYDQIAESTVPAFFLPSPHHRFQLPWLSSERPPPTPLNIYVLTLFARAQDHIYIQTPNLTCRAVLDALLQALLRGVNVTIVTSRRLMRLEQIITAGTTTQLCMKRLISRYESRSRSMQRRPDIESGHTNTGLGRLVVRYFEPCFGRDRNIHEPVQSHLKITLVDSKVVVLGSGNMDRASWFTSQELGLALTSESAVLSIRTTLAKAMHGRSVTIHDSASMKNIATP
jgi:phosphatidylserine/phosphatidylglycerophosphate/cardiolipin synthase-like enzyme